MTFYVNYGNFVDDNFYEYVSKHVSKQIMLGQHLLLVRIHRSFTIIV